MTAKRRKSFVHLFKGPLRPGGTLPSGRSPLPRPSVLDVCHWQTAPEPAGEKCGVGRRPTTLNRRSCTKNPGTKAARARKGDRLALRPFYANNKRTPKPKTWMSFFRLCYLSGPLFTGCAWYDNVPGFLFRLRRQGKVVGRQSRLPARSAAGQRPTGT